MSNISAYSQTAASNNATPPNGWPEGQSPSSVNDCAREMMAGIAKWYAGLDGSLVTTGTSNAYVLSTGSSHAALVDIGTVVFRANHTNSGAATLAVDGLASKAIRVQGGALVSGALNANDLYAATYNATDDAFDLITTPNAFSAIVAASMTVAGLAYPTADGSSGQVVATNGAGVLSFASPSQNIEYSARTSNTILAAGDKAKIIDVTSGSFTQTITAAATLGNGWYVYYKNSGTGTVTLDPNSSETIDGAATKIVYPGEELLLQCDGSNFHTFTSDKRYGTFLLSTQAASNSATIEFTGLSSTYDEYELHLINAVPASDGANLLLRTSTNGGSSYDAGASDYTSATTGGASAASSAITIAGTVGSDANENGVSGVVRIFSPSTATFCQTTWNAGYVNSAGGATSSPGFGFRASAADVDAVQFLFSAGNIESGTFKLYGVRK